jgi:N12 class adenine-specific DNA methylase
MVVAIIDTLTTIGEVCLLQGHNMNSITDSGTTRVFSDDLISTVINNVVRFVYGNSREDLNEHIKLHCVNTLSVIALNNIMKEAGYIQEWQYQDPFNKDKFYNMIKEFKEDEKGSIDIIPLFRPQNIYEGDF